MLKKITPCIAFLLVFIVMFAIPASAANYIGIDYQDYVQDVSYDANSKIVHTMFSWQLNYLQLTQNSKNLKYEYGTYNFVCDWSLLQLDPTTNLYYYSITSLPLGNRMLKLDNFPKDTEFVFSYRIEENRGNQVSCHLKIDFQWYDKDFNYIGFTTAYEEGRSLSDSKIFDISVPLQIHTPDTVKYLRIRVLLDCISDDKQYVDSFSIYPGNLYLDIPLSSLMVQEEQNQKIIDQLEDLADLDKEIINQNQTIIDQNQTQIDQNEEIKDIIENQPEQEKNEANTSGDKNVGQILDVVPNESQGFMNAIQNFAASFSYQGTDAKLMIPAIGLPEIPGLIPATDISDEMVLDFGQYITLIPNWLLVLVQSLLTIALIVYCFKELYDIISYVMTMRKGTE